ncbi:Pycsar system effector family protein [Micromonospora sp. NPDC047557]|uniref:Pycsar system effector family protein n=1 Tax=Micromonospora sp. NPDC047557 TaxID=3364250 RepID=UPI0037247CF7
MVATDSQCPGHRDDERTLGYARQLLADNRHELRRADLKATQTLGVAGAAAAGGLAALPGVELGTLTAGWLWLTACLLWCAAVAMSALALLPRLGGVSPARHVSYFGDVLRHEDLAEALHQTAIQPLGSAIAELKWTSARLASKYCLVRGAIVTLAASGLCLVGTVL